MIWTRDSILKLKEDDLTRQVLVPLFTAMGYREARFHGGGILEQGKDLTMSREDLIRGRVNVACIVKAVPITGKSSSVNVVEQLEQAFTVPFTDPATGAKQIVHECLVITPHEIKTQGTFTIQNILATKVFGPYVQLVDGVRLWEWIQRYLGERAALGTIIEQYRRLNSHPDRDLQLHLAKDRTVLNVRSSTGQPVLARLPTFAETPEGVRNRASFDHFLRTGEETVIELEHVTSGFESLLWGDFESERAGATVTLRRSVKEMRGEIRCYPEAGDTVVIPGVAMSGHVGSERLTLNNLNQEHSVHFRMTIHFADDGPEPRLQLSTAAHGVTIFWYVRGFDLLRAIGHSSILTFFEEATGLEYRLAGHTGIDAPDPPERHLELARRTLAVQDRLKLPLMIPSRPFFTDDDVDDLIAIETILASGRLSVDSLNVRMSWDQHSEAEWRRLLTEPIPDFSAKISSVDRTLLDNTFSFGPAAFMTGTARYVVQDVEQAIQALRKSEHVPITIAPVGTEHFELVFERWGENSQS